MKKGIAIIGTIALVGGAALWLSASKYLNPKPEVGQVIDSLNGVKVFYNGAISHVNGRNRTADGYNLGLKYQCVEFVKRYYDQHLHHRMPDSYGHAKDFFDKHLKDGSFNAKRGLIQYANSGSTAPKVNDLLVFDGHVANPYGHVAIVSNVNEHKIEIVQQNAGPFGSSRETIALEKQGSKWRLDDDGVLGWLHLPEKK